MILLEIYTLTRPEFPRFLTNVVNPVLSFIPFGKTLLPFQMLELARKIALAASIAISQLGPSSRNERTGHNEIDEQRLARLEFLSLGNDMSATRLLKMQMAPFNDDEKALAKLKTGMTRWLHQNTIRADPFVREAITNVTKSENAQNEGEETSNEDDETRRKYRRAQLRSLQQPVKDFPSHDSTIDDTT